MKTKKFWFTLALTILWGLAVIILTVNLILTKAELSREQDAHAAQWEQTKALLLEVDKAEEVVAERQAMVEQCQYKSELYKYSVEGLAQKVINMLHSGLAPDVDDEATAKQQADQIVCG